MANETVLFEKEKAVGLIVINRPDKRNALNVSVFQELNEILGRIEKDDTVRSIVVTGAGSAFVAGADVNELLAHDTLNGWSASRFSHSVFNRLETLPKPSVAAINGVAFGGGLELALSCTLRVASKEAKLSLPELSLGIMPGLGGTQRLMRTVGYAKAMELLLRSLIIDAAEALRIGLVHEVTSGEEVLGKAREIAEHLAGLSPMTVRLTMELMRYSQNQGFETGLAMESALASLTVSSNDAKALLEKFLTRGKTK
ncbi:MAG TPA: enoyl-CoA hydratase/isomerase family protein [Syntrophorhabdaceae bacterium]|nr:enoyl-CoA hydratase/isomerase family protein [Syntrophorhabdaceae bacterium]